MEIKPFKKEERRITIEVHQSEANLLEIIRNKCQFGEIIIETKNGLPNIVKKVTEYNKVWFN